MKNMSFKKFFSILLFSVLILTFAVFGIVIYINSLSAATTDSITTLVYEMAEHDMNNIENEVLTRFDQLDYIMDRVAHVKPDNVNELCMKLNEESASRYFDKLYIIDENGMSYSATMLTTDISSTEYGKKLLSGQDRVILRQYNSNILEATSEVIVYCMKTEPFLVGDVNIIGIAGNVSIRDLENRLKVKSFNGRGSAFVITDDGNYILNENRSVGMGKRDNLFEELSLVMDEKELEDLKIRIKEESVIININNKSNGVNEVACFIPMKTYDWTLVMRVREEVFKEPTKKFVRMSILMLITMTILFTIFSIVLYRMRMRETSARLEARSKSEFLSNMSHEIRTPLNGIIGLNELMSKNVDNTEKMREYISKSVSTANYLLALINDILDYSKMQSGNVEIDKLPFSIDEMIVSIENIIRSRANEKDISFTIEKNLTSPYIIGDMMRTEQILMNILGNAVKFTDKNGKITLEIIQTEQDKNTVKTKYSVTDNGCGISEEFQKRIFESFSQERSRNSNSIKGTGLGMAISHKLCRLMGGELVVDSRLNVGSKFSFELVTPIAENILNNEENKTHDISETQHNLNILIAEDNELNADILMELLESEGFTADHASDGGQIVEMFQRSETGYYDLILMDIQMPVRNGYEAAKIIRELDRPDAKTVRMIACTANTFHEDIEKAFESGMDDFIAKPIDVHQLMKKISNK